MIENVTIRDVASEAGVSVATVSRALRGLPSVAPATRERVEAVAARLAYVPDPYARRLSTAKNHTIIVAVPYIGQWYYSNIVTSIEALATAAGYDIRLYVASDDLQRKHFVEYVLPHAKRVDGAVLVDLSVDPDQVAPLLMRGMNVISIGPNVEGVVTIEIDNYSGAREATEHLIGLGHSRIAMLGGMPGGRIDMSIPGVREQGFRDALEQNGIPVDEDLVRNGNFSIAGGYDATVDLLASPLPPTAVFALSDEMAAGAFQAAREGGVRVPEDLSIVGFDDHEFAEAIGITTIRQPVAALGEAAMQAMLDALDGRPWTGNLELDYELIDRFTTGPANT